MEYSAAIKTNCMGINELMWKAGQALLFRFFFLIFKFYFIYFFIQQVLISYPFYTYQCIHVNPNLPIHHTTTPSPCHFTPLVSIRLFSTSVSQFLPCKPVHLYHFSRFHIYVLIYDICFSLSDILHSVWQSLDPSTSLQMTQFCVQIFSKVGHKIVFIEIPFFFLFNDLPFYLFIYLFLFIYVCVGSSFLCEGFL